MQAIVVKQKGRGSVCRAEIPSPGPGEVLVQVKAAGLCGSDLHIYHGTYPAVYPLIQGHEFSGVITAVGAGVQDWSVGQRVTADPNIFCHHCYYCKRSQENMCENAEAIGVTRNGAFAEYVLVPEAQLYELPDSVSFADGALVEPLACVLYGVQRLNMEYGGSAVIFGAGPMGLLLLKALRIGGTSRIAVVDLDAARLKLAEGMGANETFASIDEACLAHPRGFDAVVDATGSPAVIGSMFRAAARRARILQFGCANTDATVTIHPYQIYDNDWQYIGTKTAVNTYSKAIDMIAGGRIDLHDMVSEEVGFETMAAYLANGKPAGSLKILLRP